YLWLTRDDEPRLGPFARVKPPLGSAEDLAALWQHLDDIDCLATDHAPHTREEKLSSTPPPGLPGVETLLPLMLTAVHQGRLDLRRLIALTHDNPLRIFPITPPAESWVEVDPDERYTLRGDQLLTKCGWTPFETREVVGRVLRTWLRGRLAYEAGTVLAEPGTGRDLVRRA
ncbi:MAG TPA: dihydroorotase, partial [Anaerolineae bacterium]|nr:dihydroorotase [Anaerolineae bacterium]